MFHVKLPTTTTPDWGRQTPAREAGFFLNITGERFYRH
jgi:hypothetical protein